MRIVLVNNESQAFSGRAVRWEGHTIEFTSVGFESILTGLGDPDLELEVDKNNLDILAAETKDADVIYCESPEALLLWYVFSRRGDGTPPFVIEDEDSLWRVSALAAWIKKIYHEDVLADFLTDRANVWLHHNAAHRNQFLDAGLDPERLFHFPCSSYLISLVSPETFSRLGNFSPRTVDTDILSMKGAIVCPGANRRDYSTFAAAMKNLPADAWILGHRGDPPPETGGVRCKGFVPLNDFLDGLALARIIVVPMLEEMMSGGENTLTFAMALGKPVVATETTATQELILTGVSGILVPAGDADAMRAAIIFLLDDPEQAAQIGENARDREREIAALTRDTLIRAFDLVSRAGN